MFQAVFLVTLLQMVLVKFSELSTSSEDRSKDYPRKLPKTFKKTIFQDNCGRLFLKLSYLSSIIFLFISVKIYFSDFNFP